MRKASYLAVAAASLVACAGSQGPRTAEARPDAPVRTTHPYEVKGKVASVGGVLGIGKSVTIAREEAPAVQLHVAEGTRITIEDRVARLSDLREGDEVRALFDFDGSRPIAIDIEVKKGR